MAIGQRLERESVGAGITDCHSFGGRVDHGMKPARVREAGKLASQAGCE